MDRVEIGPCLDAVAVAHLGDDHFGPRNSRPSHGKQTIKLHPSCMPSTRVLCLDSLLSASIRVSYSNTLYHHTLLVSKTLTRLPRRPCLSTRSIHLTSHAMKFVGAIDQVRPVLAILTQGTSSTRFIIFNHKGKPVASHQEEFTQIQQHPGSTLLVSKILNFAAGSNTIPTK